MKIMDTVRSIFKSQPVKEDKISEIHNEALCALDGVNTKLQTLNKMLETPKARQKICNRISLSQ